MDKYEEFKKFCDDQINGMGGKLLVVGGLFKAFEEEQAKKEKEKEIKRVLDKYIVKIRFNSIYENEVEINGDAVDKCYNELKEKDLIK